jgi:hypothetical protein
MAVGCIPQIGTKFGPCKAVKGANGVTLDCGHRDCEASRNIAKSICIDCGLAIGYETAYFHDPDHEGRWAHSWCVDERIEKEQKAASG